MKLRFIPITLAFLVMAATGRAASADEALAAFFKQYLDEHLQEQPVEATRLGDHRFDAALEDLSAAARDHWWKHDRQTLRQLPRRVNYAQLTREGQIDFEIFQHELTRSIWLAENTQPFETDPRIYNDYINDSVYLLLAQSTLPKETNVAHCLARMRQLPGIVAAARANLKEPPPPILDTAIRQNRGAISFYQKGIFELAGETRQIDALRAAAAAVTALLTNYQSFLEGELSQRAHGNWRLGKKKFARKLELVLDAGLTADQVIADAEAEFERVDRELYVVARQLWSKYFPQLPLPPDDVMGRRDTVSKVLTAIGKEHGEPENLVHDARATVERIRQFIREHDLMKLPDPDRCQVIEMPEFRRGNSLAYLDSAPPLDIQAESFYAISPPPADWDANRVRSFLEEYNRHMLQILTIHEAYPGHYVQLEYANRSASLLRRVLGSGVFVEGWAVYTEQTMLDQGYGDQDLALRMSQLKFYLRAVGNAILDHQMHCTSMSDEEAMKFLTERAYQSEGEARLKITRAKQSSVQLSTYFVGRMAHYRLRQQIQRELGEQFNLGRYHEAVLANGSPPMKYLPELVQTRLRLPR